MSERMTRGFPGVRSGYDQTKPLLPTRKSKPSLSISATWGKPSARRRTSSASATEIAHGRRVLHKHTLTAAPRATDHAARTRIVEGSNDGSARLLTIDGSGHHHGQRPEP